ncbi:MAG: TetR/AcrR family transcriptional regulator [Flavobacteriaceae bacterium]
MARTVNPNRPELEQEILRQAMLVFAEKGYKYTTIEDLSAAVKLKKTSIYHYFGSKEEILFRAMQMNLRQSLDPLLEIEQEELGPYDKLRKAITVVALATTDAPFVGNLFMTDRAAMSPKHLKTCLDLRDRHETVMRKIIEDGIANGSFAQTDVKTAVRLIFGSLHSLSNWWKPGGRLSQQEVVEQYTTLLADRMMSAKR